MGGWCCAKATVLRLLVVCVWVVGGLVWRSPTRAEQWLPWLRKIPSANEVARAGRRLACATVVCLGLETLSDEQPGGVESVGDLGMAEHWGGLAREPRVEIRLRSTAMGYVRAKR